MKFGSICSGIEAASAAWIPLGWDCVFAAEVEPFPSAVIKHHYPHTPNYGDITKFKEWPDHTIDILVGGTPCQSFSIAGLRKGLDDPRGNLALVFLAIADRYRPQWVVWENVPGVHSSWSDETVCEAGEGAAGHLERIRTLGRKLGIDAAAALGHSRIEDVDQSNDFDCFVAGLEKLGYGVATTILDAQYFGVAQRRERVFVVGHLGDWQRAAAVLFEREGLFGDPPPSREKGKDVTGTLDARTSGGGGFGGDFECAGGLQPVVPPICGTLSDGAHMGGGSTVRTPTPAGSFLCMAHGQANAEILEDQAPTLNCNHEQPIIAGIPKQPGGSFDDVAHTLRAEHDASEDGTGRGTPLVAVPHAEILPTMRAASSTEAGHGGRSGSKDEFIIPMAVPINDMATRHAGTNGSGADVGKGHGMGIRSEKDPMFTLTKGDKHAVAFRAAGQDGFTPDTMSPPVAATDGGGAGCPTIQNGMQVRRLTPMECERLQGFPDNWTSIPFRGKSAADGPRYKALGNSMAVPVMRWIGQQIQKVSKL